MGFANMITGTSVEAQTRFGQLGDTAQREPVIITRHGRTAAYIISPQDMKELEDARARGDARRQRQERQWAKACSSEWNEFDDKFGSFADEHSTL